LAEKYIFFAPGKYWSSRGMNFNHIDQWM